eukprot:12898333-Prorocentrum_lima.AAC.1
MQHLLLPRVGELPHTKVRLDRAGAVSNINKQGNARFLFRTWTRARPLNKESSELSVNSLNIPV